MKPPVIPAENPDLIALVKANDRRFLVKWLITTALMAVLAVVCFSPAANKYGIPVAILLGLGFVVLPFPLCGGIGWVTDRGFAGTVWFKSFGFVQLFYSNRIETRRVSSSIIHYSLFILHFWVYRAAINPNLIIPGMVYRGLPKPKP